MLRRCAKVFLGVKQNILANIGFNFFKVKMIEFSKIEYSCMVVEVNK